MSNQINVYDLHRQALARRQRERECFVTVLERCYSRIRRVNSLNRSHCDFDVPILVSGRPLFSVDTCVKFMIRNLSGNGYVVELYPPRKLRIFWGLNPEKDKQRVRQYLREQQGEGESISATGGNAPHPPLPPLPPLPPPPPLSSIAPSLPSTTRKQKQPPPSLSSTAATATAARSKSPENKAPDTEPRLSSPSSGEDADHNQRRREESAFDVTYPKATRLTGLREQQEEANVEKLLQKRKKAREEQDAALRAAVPKPRSEAQFYRSISDFKPSGRFDEP